MTYKIKDEGIYEEFEGEKYGLITVRDETNKLFCQIPYGNDDLLTKVDAEANAKLIIEFLNNQEAT